MRIFLGVLVIYMGLVSCRKQDKIDNNPQSKLSFSTDSILFDTVFTNTGTTTRSLKIFNYQQNSVIVSNIRLTGGSLSPFKINVNGNPTTTLNNVKIGGNDSVYVFVKAFINPNQLNNPFLVQDTLEFVTNGNLQKIPLVAYGQNAVYLGGEIKTNTTFTKNKPYIIINDVTVNENVMLTVNAGSKILFQKDARLFVAGTLKVNGSFADSIVFSSSRLERIYEDEPGQWGGLHFLKQSINNHINYAVIKNALVGIRVDSLSNNTNPKLLLTNSIIKNHEVAGLLAYNSSVIGINSLYYNCGQYLLAALYGGDYKFYQNTFANFNSARTNAAVSITDNTLINNTLVTNLLKAEFINNIIWGSLSDELQLQQRGILQPVFNFSFNLIKTNISTLPVNNLLNKEPQFLNFRSGDYQLKALSEAVNKGISLSSNIYYNEFLKTDLRNKLRVFPSELGCYEN